MNAIRALAQIPPTPAELKQAQHDFWLASQPIRDVIVDIYSLSMPRITVDRNSGRIEHERTFTSEQQLALDEANRMLEDLRGSIFGRWRITF